MEHLCASHRGQHQHCIDSALATAERLCAEKALRFTDVRRQVLTLVWANHAPSKAYDILQQLRDSNTQPPTVYRALDFLQELGLVHRLSSLNAYVGCSHPQQHRECYFLICTQCGEAQECCDPKLKQSIQSTTEQQAFKADSTCLEISGRCSQCCERQA